MSDPLLMAVSHQVGAGTRNQVFCTCEGSPISLAPELILFSSVMFKWKLFTHLTDHRNSKHSSVKTRVTVECACEPIVTLPCKVQVQIRLDEMLIEYGMGERKRQ